MAGACSNKPCCNGKMPAEPNEHNVANSITGKSPWDSQGCESFNARFVPSYACL